MPCVSGLWTSETYIQRLFVFSGSGGCLFVPEAGFEFRPGVESGPLTALIGAAMAIRFMAGALEPGWGRYWILSKTHRLNQDGIRSVFNSSVRPSVISASQV